MKKEMYRQGDILLVKVDRLPDGHKKSRQGRRHMLAEGEVTGHHHVLEGPAVMVETDLEERFLKVLAEGGVLTHQEHGTIEVSAGTYQVVRQREYSPEAIRNVAD